MGPEGEGHRDSLEDFRSEIFEVVGEASPYPPPYDGGGEDKD